MTEDRFLQLLEQMLDDKLEEKLEDKLEEKLDKKFDEKLDTRFDKFELKLDKKFDEKLAPINNDINILNTKLDKIDWKLEDLSGIVTDMVKQFVTQDEFQQHERRITTLEHGRMMVSDK